MSFISTKERTLAHDTAIDPETFSGKAVPEILRTVLAKGDIFVDIGARNGVGSALVAAEAVGTTGRVIAFEPQPDHFTRLLHNVTRNRAVNTICVHAAASDETISATLFSELPDDDQTAAGQNIRVERIDALCTKLGYRQIDLVKLDVAGSELLVLRGIDKFFTNGAAPKILCQFSKCPPAMFQSHSDRVVKYLANFGYAATQVGPTSITQVSADIPAARALFWFSKPATEESSSAEIRSNRH